MKQKYKLGQEVYVVSHNAKAGRFLITKCIVTGITHTTEMINTPPGMSSFNKIDIYYDLHPYDSKTYDKIYQLDELGNINHIPQSEICRSFEEARKYVMNNFDSYFLKI